ncbi:unnamed protein product [Acanthoscelides obtectus]|uniref:Uncharacterized protein n=1 Tax=Acanthoscelides obtectus TaxID=200917 RepID=A0A9P0PNH5_ACAOB|nr:unnamed protein product [Acanthoscelides obtectus]CAK1651834.1 hypothetical protein AOBTE_LOCUS17488 [Acanthoscelides obtectus]
MCRFSYERCICFVFLVILAVLSCAGVRVDDLMTMPQVDMQRTSPADEVMVSQHRLRHHRHPRRAFVPQPAPAPRWLPLQEDDISVRAYRSQVVLLAYAEGSSHSCQFVFRVLKVYKNAKSFPIVDRIMVRLDCEEAVRGYRKKLVRNKIHLRRKYVLFLNASGSSSFQPAGTPKLVRANKEAKTDRIIRHACMSKLVPSKPSASLNVSTFPATCPMTVDTVTTSSPTLAIASTDGALCQQSHVAGELTSTAPRQGRISPIVLRDAAKWRNLNYSFISLGINIDKNTQLPLMQESGFLPKTGDDYHRIVRLFREEDVPHHAFPLPSERNIHAVVRGIPAMFSEQEIKGELEQREYTPLHIIRLKLSGGAPFGGRSTVQDRKVPAAVQ